MPSRGGAGATASSLTDLRTIVISDLHLGTTARTDLLRRADLREVLWRRVAAADRVVLLGDAIELRHGRAEVALEVAEPFFRELGAQRKEVVYVPGNHDWMVLGPWLTRRRERGLDPGLDDRPAIAELPPLARRIAEWGSLSFSYPGIWLRDDVYATHGHYSDLHTLVPTFERLAAGAMRRFVSSTGRPEAVLAPLYGWLHEVAQEDRDGNVAVSGAGASYKAWRRLGRDPKRDPRVIAAWVGVAGLVKVLDRAGLGPLSTDLSGAGLRRGGLHGMGRALQDLGVTAPHVVWGHSHRSGPWPEDDAGEWRAPGGSRMVNAGSWVYAAHFVTRRPNESPYWPGTAVLVDDDGAPPRLERLLGHRTHADLRPVAPGEDRPELDDVSPVALPGPG